ncbi:MAG TPA: nucleotidyltransferase domain-containing protein [Thermoanaerobaculia bacterium]|nr:nucleotidyltransferase domain-containing protein [Thermoanaerobaculia bacterium]
MNALDERLEREIVSRIRQVSRPSRVILFGSRAAGTATSDSDIDLQEGDEEESGAEDDEEQETGAKAGKGYTLVYDVVRRFAQPLGIDLPKWDGRVIETKKGVVRLLPATERAKQLFGEGGALAVASRIESDAKAGRNLVLPGMVSTRTQISLPLRS